ncbi:hypothetical protein D915_003119 [Fasciola hepatica]|uniref:PB1 domain-containing protein n=1 Tax=Fasciola hepatica TaxID=6192 RepID=A0A2H1CK96_FASHE|nr:hypothetical protein D915_003119 [Fasciola hepatica]
MTKVIKIVTPSERSQTNTEVTRWTVKDDWSGKVWDELTIKLQKLFHTRHTHFFISWFDGEDYCTIRDVDDLQEAVEYMQSEESGLKGIRIYASPEKKEHHTIFGKKPSAGPEEQQDLPEVEDHDLHSSKYSNEDINPLSNWELLNLDSEETKINEVVDESPKEEPKPAEEQKEEQCEEGRATTLVPASSMRIPSSIVETTSGYSETSTLASATPAGTTEVTCAAVTANAVVPGMPPTQTGSFLACMPPYGISQYYLPPTGIQPMFAPQWNGSQMVPMACPGIDPTTVQTPPQNIPTAPPMSQQPLVTSMSHTDTAQREAVPLPAVANNQQSQEQTHVPKTENRKKDKSSKSYYMPLCMQTLRSMGYTQDERTLKRVIRNKKGNLNEILDALNSGLPDAL